MVKSLHDFDQLDLQAANSRMHSMPYLGVPKASLVSMRTFLLRSLKALLSRSSELRWNGESV